MRILETVADVVVRKGDITNVPMNDLGQGNVDNILRLVFGVAGAIAVLLITIGGLKYVLSQGNPQAAAQAKDTIIYALVGLVITILGYAIVGFVVRNI